MTEVIPEPVNADQQVAHRAPRQGPPTVHQPEAEESRWIGLAILGGLLAWLGIAAGWEYIVVVLALAKGFPAFGAVLRALFFNPVGLLVLVGGIVTIVALRRRTPARQGKHPE